MPSFGCEQHVESNESGDHAKNGCQNGARRIGRNDDTAQHWVRGTNHIDKFLGSSRDDTFEGLGGADVINGGGGKYDSVDYGQDADRGGRARVTVDLSKGYAIDGFGDRDSIKNIEEVGGTRFGDVIIGNSMNNSLRGGDGNDIIKGNGGSGDYLEGQVGNDTLYGTKGTDDLFAFRDRDGKNLGTDRIKTFTDGEDKIFFRHFDDVDSKADLKITQSGADVLIDFGHGKFIIEDIKVAKLTASDFIFE